MSISDKVRAGVSSLAAIGAVKRRGAGALQAYGGTLSGEGFVISAKTGERTDFVINGQPGQRPSKAGA